MTKATGPLHTVYFRRRREGATDYAKRLKSLKGGKPRLIVRKTNKYVLVQLAEYSEAGDKILAGASSRDLAGLGFPGKCNTPSAYLTGLLVGKKAMAKGVKGAVADFGRHTASKGSLLYSALKGAADAGLDVPFDESVIPPAERIQGAHLKGETSKKFAEAKAKIEGA
jgi:large subunit ribosomal protein L18